MKSQSPLLYIRSIHVLAGGEIARHARLQPRQHSLSREAHKPLENGVGHKDQEKQKMFPFSCFYCPMWLTPITVVHFILAV